jgi:hypothetical protein
MLTRVGEGILPDLEGAGDDGDQPAAGRRHCGATGAGFRAGRVARAVGERWECRAVVGSRPHRRRDRRGIHRTEREAPHTDRRRLRAVMVPVSGVPVLDCGGVDGRRRLHDRSLRRGYAGEHADRQ